MRVSAPHAATWAWLNRPETFTEGQVPPFRVEFVAADGRTDHLFEEGVFNVHHGPLICFAGVLGRVEPPAYRDLAYCYGSYVISLRWIRPTRLQFWVEADGDATTRVRLQVDSMTRPWIAGAWSAAQRIFWSGFPTWMGRGARGIARRG